MSRSRWCYGLLALLLLPVTACAPMATPSPAASTPLSTPLSTATAAIPGTPISFAASDGTPLTGRSYGAGSTAVILSNMGDNDPGPWEAFAPELAAAGYRVITYSFRYPKGSFTEAMAVATVADLRGAAAYARAAGATRLILIGASLGGIATAKIAGELDAAAMAILASPPDLAEYGLVVSAAEMASMTGAKLFVASEKDPVVPFADTRMFYDRAAQPKQWQAYPGTEHGVLIFAGPHRDELRTLLLTFLTTHAPA